MTRNGCLKTVYMYCYVVEKVKGSFVHLGHNGIFALESVEISLPPLDNKNGGNP